MIQWPEHASEIFHRAAKHRLIEGAFDSVVLDRSGIEALLPHRDPFLLLDRVTHVDLDRALLVARYSLSRAQRIFEGHFPGLPILPGVLQIEMIGQAGLVLALLQSDAGHVLAKGAGARRTFLTHVLGARFFRPIGAVDDVEIVVRGVDDDGLFSTGVGQCIYADVVCSAAAVSCLVEEA